MIMLLGIYLLVFAVLCALQVRAVRGNEPKRWRRLCLLQLLAVIIAYGAMRYFDALPGTGMTPGLTWFAEVFYSLGAAVLYAIQLLVTFILRITRRK